MIVSLRSNESDNYHFLDKKIQFHFYINSIRKKEWQVVITSQIEEFRVCKRVLWL